MFELCGTPIITAHTLLHIFISGLAVGNESCFVPPPPKPHSLFFLLLSYLLSLLSCFGHTHTHTRTRQLARMLASVKLFFCSLKVHQPPSGCTDSRQNKLRSQQAVDSREKPALVQPSLSTFNTS